MNDEHDNITMRLESERPAPRAAFRGDLRRTLMARARTRSEAPRHLRLAITAYAGSGLLLLAIAAIGVAGVGPLAA